MAARRAWEGLAIPPEVRVDGLAPTIDRFRILAGDIGLRAAWTRLSHEGRYGYFVHLRSPRGGGATALAAAIAWYREEQAQPTLAIDLCPQNLLRLHFGVPWSEQEGWRASLHAAATGRSPPGG
ncbi:cell division protein [Chromobacterium violaceum]|uniref:Cell division protein n=1 Tax=Chromobacterium violaceum TaxID=536 RepID=A0A3S4HSC2_CHRVL|nr:cell division protein [Chromobacterium violaceum]